MVNRYKDREKLKTSDMPCHKIEKGPYSSGQPDVQFFYALK